MYRSGRLIRVVSRLAQAAVLIGLIACPSTGQQVENPDPVAPSLPFRAASGDVWLANSGGENGGNNGRQSLYLPGHIFMIPTSYSDGNTVYLQARRSDSSGTTNLRIRTYDDGDLTEAMTLLGGGNIGIGKTSPISRLHIVGPRISDATGSTAAGILRLCDDAGHALVLDGNQIESVNERLFLNHRTDNDIILAAGGGNVGINTGTPTSPLTVAGMIETTRGGIRFPDGTIQTTAAQHVMPSDLPGIGEPGSGNVASGDGATTAGGIDNTAGQPGATVGGGLTNSAQGRASTVGGGEGNIAASKGSTVAGGKRNTADSLCATVGGGEGNTARGEGASVAGGYENLAGHRNTTVGGGERNTIHGASSTIAGGERNTISGASSTIAGGLFNLASSDFAAIAGGLSNDVMGSFGAIGGGGPSNPADDSTSNRVTDDYGVVAGGGDNQAGNGSESTTDAPYATVGGGQSNSAEGSFSSIGGGWQNVVLGKYGTIGGGGPREISVPAYVADNAGFASNPGFANYVYADYGTISGGANNQAGNGIEDGVGTFATVGGGLTNSATMGYATVCGGQFNSASGQSAAVGGGGFNTAEGAYAAVAGGWGCEAFGDYATIPGGFANLAPGQSSFAAGYRAKAEHDGCFVWADRSTEDVQPTYAQGFSSTNDNQFLIRAEGGVGINTNEPSSMLTVAGRIESTDGGVVFPDGSVQLAAFGGRGNSVTGHDATVGGGRDNEASGETSTVAGGRDNFAIGQSATVGGGVGNRSTGHRSTIAGGGENTADFHWSSIGGGQDNYAGAMHAVIAGGASNQAHGQYATIPGGSENQANGQYSLAAGLRAIAYGSGCFVWADSIGETFESTSDNQFLIRATGGVGINTNAPSSTLTVAGTIESTTGGFVFPDGTVQRTASSTGVSDSDWPRSGLSGSDPSVDYLGTSDSQPLVLRTDAIERVRISASGNVGIGTSEPGRTLDVVGSGRFAGSLTIGDYTLPANAGGPGTVLGMGGSGSLEWVPVAGDGWGDESVQHTEMLAGNGTAQSPLTIARQGASVGQVLQWDGNAWAPGDAALGQPAVEGATGSRSTVCGGEENRASGRLSTVGGGSDNEGSGYGATAAGGTSNVASGRRSTVSGGALNSATGEYATVSGGMANSTEYEGALGDYAAIGGGRENKSSGEGAVVGGGQYNKSVGSFGTVGGGYQNRADAANAAVGGGIFNTASGESAVVGGGTGNRATAECAVVPGGSGNTASAPHAFAAGMNTTAGHRGAFVWGGAVEGWQFSSDFENEFSARAIGGVRFVTGTESGKTTAGVELAAGGSSWDVLCDRSLKTGVTEVDSHEILSKLADIPVTEWSLIAQDPSIRHIGPMAQDFREAFGLGTSDRFINSSDIDGIALISIQALHEITQEQATEIEDLRAEINDLHQRLDRLEELVTMQVGEDG